MSKALVTIIVLLVIAGVGIGLFFMLRRSRNPNRLDQSKLDKFLAASGQKLDINLDDQLITSMDDNLNFGEARSLSIRYNKISKLPKIASASLEVLLVDGNPLTKLYRNVLKLPMMTTFSANNCSITNIDKDTFILSTGLQSISLVGNPILESGTVTIVDGIITTLVDQTDVVFPSYSRPTVLKEADFNKWYEKLADKSNLYLNNKNITGLFTNFGSVLKEDTFISLNNNKLTSLPSLNTNMSYCTKIDLSSNAFTSIDGNMFSSLTGVYRIYLNSNLISTIAADAFVKCTKLVNLFLTDNPIASKQTFCLAPDKMLNTLNNTQVTALFEACKSSRVELFRLYNSQTTSFDTWDSITTKLDSLVGKMRQIDVYLNVATKINVPVNIPCLSTTSLDAIIPQVAWDEDMLPHLNKCSDEQGIIEGTIMARNTCLASHITNNLTFRTSKLVPKINSEVWLAEDPHWHDTDNPKITTKEQNKAADITSVSPNGVWNEVGFLSYYTYLDELMDDFLKFVSPSSNYLRRN
jgi:Leucine-rich repeat (LRR) protein